MAATIVNHKYPSPLPPLLALIAKRLALLLKPKMMLAEEIASDGNQLEQRHRSVFLRHLDCGSCNGCELELNALSNPLYDSERFGIKFEASPRHADVLILTGIFTRNLAEAAELTFAAMPKPGRIILVGDCAIDGGIFLSSYAMAPRSKVLDEAVVGKVEGCPPAPPDILRAIGAINW